MCLVDRVWCVQQRGQQPRLLRQQENRHEREQEVPGGGDPEPEPLRGLLRVGEEQREAAAGAGGSEADPDPDHRADVLRGRGRVGLLGGDRPGPGEHCVHSTLRTTGESVLNLS